MTIISTLRGMAQSHPPFRRLLILAASAALAALVVLGALPAHAQSGRLGERDTGPRCPPGSVLIGGRCVRPEVTPQCPPATVGRYPNCRPVVRQFCPRGTAGVYPNCRPTVQRPPPLNGPQLQPVPPPRPRIYGSPDEQ